MDPEKVTSEIIRCVNFAAIKHKNQRRKNSEQTPYINHPIGVANILCNESKVRDLAIVQAALLHDTVEDTDTTIDEIRLEFGQKVADIVAEVTDDKTLDKSARKEAQVVDAPKSSYSAKCVKLADKLYNLRDLENATPVGWSEDRVLEYFQWACRVFEGLRGTDPILEQKLEQVFKRRGIQ